jgi:hypothetical protein
MLKKLTATLVFVLAIAPSAYLAWTLRAMPHLGFYHDDSIYWVSAKSLAEGHREYRDRHRSSGQIENVYHECSREINAGAGN